MSNEPGFKPVQILADSSCDLPQEVLDRYNIRIIPMYIALGEKDYRDGDITATDIYAHFEKTQQTPKTAAPNVSDYQDLFKPFIDEGKEIVSFSISSQMSGSFQNARAAAESFPDVGIYCIDSKSLSSGVGLQIMHACELAEAGKSAGEIAREALLMAERTQASFVLAQLEYLHRGGRCSAVSAYAATLLSIRPEILVKDGAMIPGSKYRGGMVKVAKGYVKRVLKDSENIDPRRAFVTYTQNTDQELIDTVYGAAKDSGFFEEILTATAGCTITSHCGPNTIGLLYFYKDAPGKD
ncbi:MAG: DegV family protein [Christensenellales bacterium]|jgi:DegV family protein with EDD domain